MLLNAGLDMKFWAEAIKTATYLHRRTPTSSLTGFKSPYEELFKIKPKLEHLRRFGCTVYKFIPKEQRIDKKFGMRSQICMFLGYVHDTTKIWRLWDINRRRAIECSNVIFREDENACQAVLDEDAIRFMSKANEDTVFPERMNSEAGHETDDEYPPESDESRLTVFGEMASAK